jgi:hypothetical protein
MNDWVGHPPGISGQINNLSASGGSGLGGGVEVSVVSKSITVTVGGAVGAKVSVTPLGNIQVNYTYPICKE